MPSVLFLVVLLVLAAERAFELALDRRHARALAARGARWMERDGFALIVAAQGLLFAGTVAEVALAPWSREGWWTWPLVLVLVLAQALRYWAIATLGEHWSIRVVTVPGAPRITGGPYRFLPHPNYLAVMLEALVLPLAFGAWGTALVAGMLQLIALWRRIRSEERALGEVELR